MRVAACTIAYREEEHIERAITQFKGFVDLHLVLISKKPWHGQEEPLDRTEELAELAGAEPVTSSWVSEKEQRNFGQVLLDAYDWILIVDADEYYEEDHIKAMLAFLESAPLPAYGIGRLKTYWKDGRHVVDPEENGGLIVAVRPAVRFVDKRCISSQWGFLPKDIVMHHHSYVRSDAGMLRKISTFEHQHEIIPGWYEEKWLQWTPEMEDLHPVNPPSFKRAILCD